MGERKGQNKYYPPDFDPKKHRSLDAYHGTHALRERARKLGEGILIIRFEMPYNIWCDGCKNPIGMGVRYNAEKSKIGMYYTTPIYKFRMKCHLCDMHFEIKTDPANHDYVIMEGARRKEQRWDPKENEQIVPEDKNDQKRLATDAMYKMEHSVEDKNKSKAVLPGVSQLAAIREQWKDDYEINKHLRGQFRAKKKEIATKLEQDKALLEKSSLDIELLPDHEDDKKMAQLLRYRTVASYDEKRKQKRDEISNRSIFNTFAKSPSTPSSSSGSSDSLSGLSSPAQIKHEVAHKTLSNIVVKRKNPFSVGVGKDSPSQRHLISKKDVGVVRTKLSTSKGSRTTDKPTFTDQNSKSSTSETNTNENNEGSSETGQSVKKHEGGYTENALSSLMLKYEDSGEDSE